MRHPAHHFFDLAPGALQDLLVAREMRRFRADQLLTWVYLRCIADPQRMTNLSNRDRETVSNLLTFESCETVRSQRASDGTRKLLLRWSEDQGSETGSGTGASTPLPIADPPTELSSAHLETECVMIPAGRTAENHLRRTACISSQVGCPVGCTFCASGLGGLDGNLSAGRIVEQVWHLNRELSAHPAATERDHRHDSAQEKRRPERITNVVFMGMGEPLANYQSVINAIRILNADWAFNISARRITVSTVGLPAAIRRLAKEQLPVTLALSLHAPDDSIRRELIPWAEYATIDELMDACMDYFTETGREVTFEYTLIDRVNDRPEHARQLARIVKRVRGNVNLIRYNEVAGLPYKRPADEAVHEFQGILRSQHVNAHIRASRGRDIAAACGQLRHEARDDRRRSVTG